VVIIRLSGIVGVVSLLMKWILRERGAQQAKVAVYDRNANV